MRIKNRALQQMLAGRVLAHPVHERAGVNGDQVAVANAHESLSSASVDLLVRLANRPAPIIAAIPERAPCGVRNWETSSLPFRGAGICGKLTSRAHRKSPSPRRSRRSDAR